jgi:hypothetical protein
MARQGGGAGRAPGGKTGPSRKAVDKAARGILRRDSANEGFNKFKPTAASIDATIASKHGFNVPANGMSLKEYQRAGNRAMDRVVKADAEGAKAERKSRAATASKGPKAKGGSRSEAVKKAWLTRKRGGAGKK